MLIIDITGESLTKEDCAMLNSPLVSGVILFARNYANIEQLFQLTRSIHEARSPHLPKLLICVDQEGGRVQRFKSGFTHIPAASYFASLYKAQPEYAQELVHAYAQVLALELLASGVDLTFAPVLDLDYQTNTVIGDRAYGDTPEIVIALAGAFIDGLCSIGLSAVGKHFPGHGFVSVDSHHALPIDTRSFDEIKRQDLLPFQKLNVSALMTAHIQFPEVDAQPVTFSKTWLKDILQDQLNFQGIIISDDLAMGATNYMSCPIERVLKAKQAGCNLLIFCNNKPAINLVLESDRLKDIEPYDAQSLIPDKTIDWSKLEQDPTYISARRIIQNDVLA